MSRILSTIKSATVILSAISLGAGCSAFRASVQNDDVAAASAKPMDTGYDFGDLRWLGDTVAADMIATSIIGDASRKPILVVMGIENRTDEHIDTKAITDTMRTKIINAGKADFVNESRRDNLIKEQGYQLANCTPETRTMIGKQLGARYMLTGSLVKLTKDTPRQVRVSKQEQVYLQLTVEVTDLETGLIAWTTQKERVRSARKPIIGW
ncbi:MAG: hypothetical protein WCO77_00810 [bacterium]